MASETLVQEKAKPYDVVIVGAGVTGSALAYMLTNYTDIGRVALLEKYNDAAPLNSNSHSNSQSLHFGDIESNMGLESIVEAKKASEMIKAYAAKHDLFGKIVYRLQKMLLAVGDEEIQKLRQRYEMLQKNGLFPKDKYLGTLEEIAEKEPMVALGRKQPVAAIYSDEGYAVDYGKLAESFIEHSRQTGKVEAEFSTKVQGVEKVGDGYIVKTDKGDYKARFVVFASGAHSLYFAKKAGIPSAKDLGVLCVAGDFYFLKKKDTLRGKVYTMQDPKLPFAAVHGDPDVNGGVRFGPTAKVILELERGNYASVLDYFRSLSSVKAMAKSFANILKDKTRRDFALKNFIYALPVIGKHAYLREIRKVVPTAEAGELEHARGGVRPQVVDTRKGELVKGEVKLADGRLIFNMTPSPGATKCMFSAAKDMEYIVRELGAGIDREHLEATFGSPDKPQNSKVYIPSDSSDKYRRVA